MKCCFSCVKFPCFSMGKRGPKGIDGAVIYTLASEIYGFFRRLAGGALQTDFDRTAYENFKKQEVDLSERETQAFLEREEMIRTGQLSRAERQKSFSTWNKI